MQANNIATLPELQAKVSDFYGRLSDVRERFKPIEKRLKTLDEHINKAEIIGRHRAVYSQYMAQKPKKKEAFYEAHRADIILYEAANRYLKNHLNGAPRFRSKHGKPSA